MANLARFTINGTPSTNRGFDATVAQVLTLAIEAPSSLMQRVTFEVYNPADTASPLASKGAELLSLVGGTTGQKVDAATPAAGVTVTMPGSAGARSWLVRCSVNGGVDARGKPDSELVFERMVALRSPGGRRKIVASEGTQYEVDGWAGAQGDDVDNPGPGTGDVVGPVGVTDLSIAVFDGATGKILKPGLTFGDIGQAFNVKTFGAVPGGTNTVIQAAIQAAITACFTFGGGGVVFIPRGIYAMVSALGFTIPDGVTVMGEGEATTLDWSTAVATTTCFAAQGSEGLGVALTGNAAKRTKDLDAPAAGFANDDWVKVYSDAITGANNLKKGEIVQLDVAGTMTLRDPLQDDYATADAAKVAKMTFRQNVSVQNLRILGPVDTSVAMGGVLFDRVLNGRIENVTCERVHNYAISVQDSVSVRVSDCYWNKNQFSSTAYGLLISNAAQNITVTNVQGWRLRHLVTGGGNTSRYGVPRRVTVTCAQAFQCLQSGFDMHGGCEDWQFGDCHVLGSLNDGFTLEGVSATLTGCTTKDCVGPAIRMRSFNNKPYKATVTGGRFEGVATLTGSRGIELEIDPAYTSIESINVTGATFSDHRYGFRHINASGVPTRGLNISNNNFVRCSLNSESVIFIVNAFKPICNGNSVHDAGVGSDGISYQDVTGGTIKGNSIDLPGTGTCRAIRLLGTSNRVAIDGNEASGGSNSQGISIQDTCTNCAIGGANNLLGCQVQLVLGLGTGHTVEMQDCCDPVLVSDDYDLPNITFPQHRIIEVDVAAGTWSDAADKVTLPVTPIRGERVTIMARGNASVAGDNVDIDSGDTITGDSLIVTNNGSRTYVAISDTLWRLMASA